MEPHPKLTQPRSGDVFAIIISVTLVLEFIILTVSGIPSVEYRLQEHMAIVENTAIFPYAYRVLVAFTLEPAIQLLSHNSLLDYRTSFIIVYAASEVVVHVLLLWSLFTYSSEWFSPEQSLIGCLFVAAMLPFTIMTIGSGVGSVQSVLEVTLFALALSAILHHKHRWLALLIALAALNRETAVFIVLAFAAVRIDLAAVIKRKQAFPRRDVLLAIAYFTIWMAIYSGLRLIRGPVDHPYSLLSLWQKNTQPAYMAQSLISILLFLGFYWIFAIRGFQRAPQFVRRTAWIIPPYLLLILIFGEWHETRLYMFFYPILIPMGLAFLFRSRPSPDKVDQSLGE